MESPTIIYITIGKGLLFLWLNTCKLYRYQCTNSYNILLLCSAMVMSVCTKKRVERELTD